jgi:hypothetical protein
VDAETCRDAPSEHIRMLSSIQKIEGGDSLQVAFDVLRSRLEATGEAAVTPSAGGSRVVWRPLPSSSGFAGPLTVDMIIGSRHRNRRTRAG